MVEPLAEAALAEGGREGAADHPSRLRVGERALVSIASLDLDLPVLARDEDEDAVVLALLAELPRLEDADGEALHVLAVERADEQVLELGAMVGALLPGGAAERLEAPAIAGVEEPRLVHDRPRERRHVTRGGGEGRREQEDGHRHPVAANPLPGPPASRGREIARPSPQNFTFGACSALAVVAENCGLGCFLYSIEFVQLVGGTVTRLLNCCTESM